MVMTLTTSVRSAPHAFAPYIALRYLMAADDFSLSALPVMLVSASTADVPPADNWIIPEYTLRAGTASYPGPTVDADNCDADGENPQLIFGNPVRVATMMALCRAYHSTLPSSLSDVACSWLTGRWLILQVTFNSSI
eukprot:SAG31_NODE_6583_length_1963_cov_1.684013_2_plen_137_part_00